jgi:hypothetical protein
MCVSARRDYDGGDSAASAARDFGNAAVMAALQPSGWSVGDDVAIVLSELVTEALEDGAGAVSVHVTVHFDHIDIALERRVDGGGHRAGVCMPAETGLRTAVLGALTTDISRTALGEATMVRARLACDPSYTTDVRCVLRGNLIQ